MNKTDNDVLDEAYEAIDDNATPDQEENNEDLSQVQNYQKVVL